MYITGTPGICISTKIASVPQHVSEKISATVAFAYLSNSSPEIFITCSNNVTPMLSYTLTDAIVRICSLVCAGQLHYPRVFGDLECNAIFLS